MCTNRWLPVADRLRALGRHLVEIGTLKVGEFDEFVRLVILRHVCERTAHEEALLRQCGGHPEFWAAELRADIESRLAAAVRPEYIVPADIPNPLPKNELLRLAQDLIRRYGELAVLWPDIVQESKALVKAEQLTTRIR
jgi:hypothetical protein